MLLVLLAMASVWSASPALAASATSFPESLPQERLIDPAGVFSRAAAADVGKALEGLTADHVDARLLTVERLDYGVSLQQLGQQLLQRWEPQASDGKLLLVLIDAQTNAAALLASPDLASELDPELLRSTARTTMAMPLRDGARYRQASLDAIARLRTVLEQGDDPGEPTSAELERPASNVPTREETASSNAFTWVVALLVVGSVVPMVTWWVFSR
ncbi:MAG: TPM domain-containing protein [Cyanobacteriota bacterium]|nr:TPM domain-containing protein [Cyanobacteriota bacterium]